MSQSKSAEAGCLGQQRGVSSCQPRFRVASVHTRVFLPSFPFLPPKSMGMSVARRCFEDTSIVARSWYEADVSDEKREERAGCDGSRSPGLDSLADKTHACRLFCTLAAEHRQKSLLTIVGDKRACCHCHVRMRGLFCVEE
jgi:hypothetical protein